jgi:hypothetical protein
MVVTVEFEVFTVVNIEVEAFWVVTPCNVAVGSVFQRTLLPPSSE